MTFGQAQYIRREAPGSNSDLAPLLDWMRVNAAAPVTLEMLANRARMSTRTFSRRFREQTGTTPLQWLLTTKIRKAQDLLETTTLTVEQVALATGFESGAALRDRFRREVGVSPRRYRAIFPPPASSNYA